MMKNYIRLLGITLISIIVIPMAFANNETMKDVLPDVALHFTTNLQTKSLPNSLFCIEINSTNRAMLNPYGALMWGMYDKQTTPVIVRLHGENVGSRNNNQAISTTDFVIKADNNKTFSILEVKLDANTSKLLSVHWIMHKPFDLHIAGVKPAVCSYTVSGQNIDVNITNQ